MGGVRHRSINISIFRQYRLNHIIHDEGLRGEMREWHVTIALWVNTQLNLSCYTVSSYSASNHANSVSRQERVCDTSESPVTLDPSGKKGYYYCLSDAMQTVCWVFGEAAASCHTIRSQCARVSQPMRRLL